MKIIYEGFFVNPRIELKGTLDKDIEFKHITTEFRPHETHEHLYGINARFRVCGYSNDGNNEGILVELIYCENRELVDLYNNISRPHITLSISNDSKPQYTSNIEFTDDIPSNIDETIDCVFGGFVGRPMLQIE